MDSLLSNQDSLQYDSPSEYAETITDTKSVAFSELQSASLSSRIWDTPPKSMLSRIGRREKEREVSRKKLFLHQLREAFDASDIENNGTLTYDAWCYSKIQNVIHDGHLSPQEYDNYFKRIDVNSDGIITWNELVAYLMSDIKSTDFKSKNDAAQFIRKMSYPPKLKSHYHREMVQQIAICNSIGEYITVSTDSIRFWNPTDLTFTRALFEPGQFSRILVIETFSILVITTTNRRLLFFDAETLTQLPLEIGASPSASQIKLMSQNDAKDALKVINSPMMPLYNLPMTLAMADEILNDKRCQYFWIGDDQGTLEFYMLIAPMRRKGLDYRLERVARHQMHKNGITQITFIPSLACYASSSMDHSVKFWTYNDITRKFTVIRTFVDQTSVLGFHYSTKQKALTTCPVSRDAYVWSISPPQHMFQLTGHYNQLSHISDFVTSNGENYIVTMTCKKEFKLWDCANYNTVREWTDPTILRPENHYGAMLFDEKRHTLITAASFPVKWAEDVSAFNEAQEPVTHGHSIVGCLYTKEFNEIVTVDSFCTIKVWDIETGRNSSSHIEPWSENFSEICTVSLDSSGRRLFTSSFKNKLLTWNYNSGSFLEELVLLPEMPLVTIIKFCVICQRSFLVRAGWDKTLCIYLESDYNQFDLFRKYTGHTSDISTVSSFSQGFVSGSVNGEVFAWSLDTSYPIASIKIKPVSTIETIECYDNFVFVGDSNGTIHVLALPKLYETLTLVNAHNICLNHSITAICGIKDENVLFTADTLGYLKRWNVECDQNTIQLTESQIQRCHNAEITNITLCCHNMFIATCSADQCVRIWRKDTFEYVGFFSEISKWNLNDPSTWIIKSPFEVDEEHFIKPKTSNLLLVDESSALFDLQQNGIEEGNVKRSTSRSSILSMRKQSILSTRSDRNDEQIINELNQQPKEEFDPVKFMKVIDEYSHESEGSITKKKEGIMNMIRENDNPVVKPTNPRKPKLLQMSQRPAELLESINKILNNEEETPAATSKPMLKIPMVSPKKSKSSLGKKGKRTVTLYAPTLFD